MTTTDYYKILGLSETASLEDIKKAFRSLAMKHHPDRGGDQSKFKDISAAYDTLSDPSKRAEYDQSRKGGHPFNTGQGFHEFNDIFGGSPFGSHFNDIFGRHTRVPRNRDLNIKCQISFVESYTGKQLEANYTLPSGKNQTVVINIPPGIAHGDMIKYAGLGDDSIPGVPRGGLNVTILVNSDPLFSRNGLDIYTSIFITPIEAMIGCKKKIKIINGQEKELNISPGTQSGTEFAINGHGFSDSHRPNIKGRFVTVVEVKIPRVDDPTLIAKLREIDNDIGWINPN